MAKTLLYTGRNTHICTVEEDVQILEKICLEIALAETILVAF